MKIKIPSYAKAAQDFRDKGCLPTGYRAPIDKEVAQNFLDSRMDAFRSYKVMDNGPDDLDPRENRLQLSGFPEDNFEVAEIALSGHVTQGSMTLNLQSDAPDDLPQVSHTVFTPTTVREVSVSESDFHPKETSFTQVEWHLATSGPTPIGSGSTTVKLTPQAKGGLIIVNDSGSDHDD